MDGSLAVAEVKEEQCHFCACLALVRIVRGT